MRIGQSQQQAMNVCIMADNEHWWRTCALAHAVSLSLLRQPPWCGCYEAAAAAGCCCRRLPFAPPAGCGCSTMASRPGPTPIQRQCTPMSS